MIKKYQEFISNVTSEVEGEFITGLCNIKIEEFDYDAPSQSKLADYSYIMLLIDKLSARSYSLIEACITDKNQQAAMKLSLRGIIDEQRDKAYRELVLGQ